MRAIGLSLVATGLLAACAPIAAAPMAPAGEAAAAFTNPLLASGPDPWIAQRDGVYYFMATRGDRLTIRKTRDVARLADAPEVTVWTPPTEGPNAKAIWAPELHRIGDKWYIYYSAAASGSEGDARRGVFVLENAGDDPTTGAWIDRGQLHTQHSGIDGTTFAYRGRRYFVYAPYVGPDSDLAIVRMANPWTLEGPETIIARPTRAWQQHGKRPIVEGPEFLLGPKGDLFITFSGSACWSDDYAIGLLHAAPGSDPLDAAAWRQIDGPVLAKSVANSVYAPGHNGFFTSPDGRETWIVYHANPAAGMKCTGKRSPRIQRIDWSAKGWPIFPEPAAAGAPLAAPAR